MKDIAIYGVGGFGREVLALIKDINAIRPLTYNILGFFDDGYPKGEIHNGFPILGGLNELNQWNSGISIALALGSCETKKSLSCNIYNPLVSFPTLIHPTCYIGDPEFVKIGKGCIVCANNHITTNVKIGDFVVLNLCCTTGHDCVIGDYCSFMPSVNISGEVIVGECVYCGTGVKIINRLSIGEYSTIGAGAVVTRPIPAYCTAVGMPAKPIRFHNNLNVSDIVKGG